MRRFALAFACAAALVSSSVEASEGRALASLRWAGEHDPQRFVAVLGEAGRSTEVDAWIATHAHARRWTADLAYARLARALGASIVPPTEVRRVRFSELLAAAASDPATLAHVKREARVLNDGAVTVRTTELPGAAREVPVHGAEVAKLAAWAEGREPLAPGDELPTAAWVTAMVLDYVSGNVMRRSIHLDVEGRRLSLVDNGGAFFEHPTPSSLAPLLDRLRKVSRFPRSLASGLAAFDRARAESIWHDGAYGDWLVASRPLAECVERARAVETLVEARVAERGKEATWDEL